MRPDDEPRDPEPEDDAPTGADAGEHEAPPPATYAGRKRAEAADEQPKHEAPDAEAHDAGDHEGEHELDAADEDDGEHEDDDGDGEHEDDGEDGEHEDEGEDGEHEDEGEDEDGGGDEENEHEDDGDTTPIGGDQTVEADTLALADKSEAEEAALAGLRARSAETGTKTGVPAVPSPAEAAAPEAIAAVAEDGEDGDGEGDGKTPRARRLWPRFLAASMLIVVSIAAATSISLLAYLTDIAAGLSDNDQLASLRDQLTEAPAGDPQTILIIGSDKRLDTKGDPGRSDTTILLRVDPDKHAIALLSIPRDLRVNIPGVGVDKFNAAYSAGGPDKTLRVVEQVTGLEINHVVNINFTGFADAVNAIGCVYIDVDRHYFNDNSLAASVEDQYAEINVEAGYQRMCGFNALQYVRFRHFDNDLVRAARQQDFLREARQKLPPGVLIRDRNELLDIFTEYTTSDIGEAVPLLELLKTFLSVQSAPVREVHFPAELGETYVTADDKAIKKAVAQFLNAEGTPGERPAGDSPAPDQKPKPKGNKPNRNKPGGDNKPRDQKPKPGGGDHFEGPTMDDSTEQGSTYANQASLKKRKNGKLMIDFPVFYPTRLVPGSFITRDSRAFIIDGPDKDVYYGYKMVVDVPGDTFGHGLTDEYYGVSGTDWVDAPILEHPSETRTIDGRDYLLFYDGDRLRLVGWKTGKAAYWVNNTLLQSLEEGQMLSIATSMRELKGK